MISSAECNFPALSFVYGSGTISRIDTTQNTYTVRDESSSLIIKFYSCSVLLGPGLNYVAKIGDIVCYKALRVQDGTLVVAEALVLGAQ